MPIRLYPILIFSGVVAFSILKESREIFSNDLVHDSGTPELGSGNYESSMVGTIGKVIAENDLQHKSVAVWGGDLANAHDLPFLYRVTADWFILPEKPLAVVANAEEASKYEYILSPWDSAYDLKTSDFQVTQIADRNFVRLYKLGKLENAKE